MIQYTNYFRQLAKKHYLIRHNPLAEDKSYVNKSECRFAMFHHDEVVSGLRTAIGDGPIVFVHPYYATPYSNDAGDFRGKYTGAFIIAKKSDPANINNIISNYDLTELIAWHFIAQIGFDANETDKPECDIPSLFFSGVDFNRMKLEPVHNLWNGMYGWYVEFQFDIRKKFGPQIHNESTVWLPDA
jgi:hypothetical protein